MDCSSSHTLACELGRIADALDGFDWNNFVSTLIATLVGAGIAALVSFLVFRGERAERYEVAVDEAATRLMNALHEYAKDYRRFIRDLTDWLAKNATAIADGRNEAPRPLEPERAELDISVDVLIVKSRRKDREIATRIRQVVYELTFTNDADWLVNEHHTLRRVIAAWRAKRRTAKETLASLATIDTRRALKQAGNSDAELPPAPEPYERRGAGSESSRPPAH